MIDRQIATFGRLDMAFNNAGIQIPPTDAADEPAGSFDRVNAINLRGVWACMKHELRPVRAQDSGGIVNCSSLGASSDSPAGRLLRVQARRDRPDPQRRTRIRAARSPHHAVCPRTKWADDVRSRLRESGSGQRIDP